jgi:hypothetical protein
VDDLDGRVLSIERSAKDSVIGPTKTNRFLARDHGDGRTSPHGVEDGLVPKFVGLDRLPSLELRPPIGGHIRGFHGHGATQTAAYLGSM